MPTVTGASGDGNGALARALQAELLKNGVKGVAQRGQIHKIECVVNMGAPVEGKQSVRIHWHVADAQGKRVGTITQENEVSAGSLDVSWGQTADAAASAAAQGILKLLSKSKV